MSRIRSVVGLGLLFVCAPVATAQAGFAPANETIFEAEQTSVSSPATDAAGNSIVAWSQEKTLGDPREAKARRLTAAGTLGPVIELAPGQIGAEPAVAMTLAGRAFVAWEARTLEADPDSVKGRWIEPSGALGPLLTLVEGKVGEISAADVRVVVDPAGVATVSWENTADGSKLSVRRVQPDSTLGALVPDISGGGGILNHLTVALANGSTVAIWSGSGIVSNVLDANLGFGVPVKLSSTGAASNPEVAVDALGNALVAWRAAVGENWGVFGRHLGSTGVPSGVELTIDPLAAESADSVSVAADSAKDFVITWSRQNGANQKTVLARGTNLDTGFAGPAQPVSTPALASPGARAALFDNGVGAVYWKSGTSGLGETTLGRSIDRTGLPTSGIQELFANAKNFNAITVSSAPAIGLAAFMVHYPISGSAQGAVVRRFLAPPACADSNATVVQGKPIAAPLSCVGAAIEAAALVEKPKHGTVGAFDLATLSFAYTPKPGYKGSDSFTFAASNDGGTSGVARVTIKVGKDTVKPKIKKLKLIRKGKAGKQTFKLRVVLSETARVKVTIKSQVRVGGKTKLRKLGKVVSEKTSRKATIAVKGKLARKLRSGGSFRAVAVATDPAGNKSAPKRQKFRLG